MSDEQLSPVQVALSRRRLLRALRAVRGTVADVPSIREAIRRDENRRYVAFSLDEWPKVSFSLNDDPYKSRYKCSLGRYARRHLQADCSDTVLEEFVAAVCANGQQEVEYQLLQGQDIVAAYERCVGGSSCMTGSSAYKTSIYAHNECVRLLVCRVHGSPIARALVWECDDGTSVLDRIYPNSGNHVAMIRKYAIDRGWVRRYSNSMPDEEGTIALSDDDIHTVTINSPDGLWPYLDTFCFARGHATRAVLCNCDEEGPGYPVVLQDTGGGWPGEQSYCTHCGRSFDTRTASWLRAGLYCPNCANTFLVYSSIHDRWLVREDAICFNDTGNWATERWASAHASTCSGCGEHFEEQDSLQTFRDCEFCSTCFDEEVGQCEECSHYAWDRDLRNGLCDKCEAAHDQQKQEVSP